MSHENAITEFRGFTLTGDDFRSMTPEAQWYLISYGFKKSLQDSVSGKAKELEGEGWSKAQIEDELRSIMESRFDAIRAGEVSSRSAGPRLKGLEKIVAEVAEEALKAVFAKQGKKWPSGKGSAEAIAALREKYLAKYGEKVRAEAERRMEAAEDFDIEL